MRVLSVTDGRRMLCGVLIVLTLSISSAGAASFQAGIEVGRIAEELNEVSGLAQSRTQSDVFWVHNDSGDQARVYAIDRKGALLGTFTLAGAEAIDWEDMAIGPARGGVSYLYLADIGDNRGSRRSVRIYRVLEPRVARNSARVTGILRDVVTFDFVYADGPRDAEAFMVDPLTNDFYIVTKREPQGSRLYRSSAPVAGATNTLVFQTAFPFSGATGAAISPDGLQVLIRRYSNAPGRADVPAASPELAGSYWRRRDATVSLVDLLRQPGETVSLVIEEQGEAIAFASDGRGFYTTSERAPGAQAPAAPLTYYAPVQ
jgi:hypothetical protein